MWKGEMDKEVSSTSSAAKEDEVINILLLGETGVGKSTFINSFVNYLKHTTFTKALTSELACLIPLQFTVPNKNYEDRFIKFGADSINEDTELGNSSTQGARAYLFPFEQHTIRIIDTPGIGDARGVEKDDTNFENVLDFISHIKHLHGICFLLKPNVSVINAYFKFCIVHLLSRLDKSAASNIVFIFTNTRGTFYRPGETLPLLRKILKEIKDTPPHVNIPCNHKNMFCVDNEAFKFLIAKKNGIEFDARHTKEFATSWETSYQTCKEILAYICGSSGGKPLKPHNLQNTISVNRARKIITDLSKPLADISDLIQDNLIVLTRHEKVLQDDKLSRNKLLQKLHVPTIKLEVTHLKQPVTVCAASKCSEIYTCGELNKYHYKQRCHNPCYLRNVPKEIIGTKELLHCEAMSGTVCRKCGCQYTAHMHVYYESRIMQSEQVDVSIQKRIKTKEDEIAAKQFVKREILKTIKEYEFEKKEISKCMAKFAHYFKENSISAYNDAYIDYLDYLIEREKLLGDKKDQARIRNYNSLKSQYEQEKKVLDSLVQDARLLDANAKIVNESDIADIVQILYNLKHTGSKIYQLHSIQQNGVQQSVYSQECIYNSRLSLRSTYVKREESSSAEDEACQLHSNRQNGVQQSPYSQEFIYHNRVRSRYVEDEESSRSEDEDVEKEDSSYSGDDKYVNVHNIKDAEESSDGTDNEEESNTPWRIFSRIIGDLSWGTLSRGLVPNKW